MCVLLVSATCCGLVPDNELCSKASEVLVEPRSARKRNERGLRQRRSEPVLPAPAWVVDDVLPLARV